MLFFFFFFQAEDGIRDKLVTGVQTCALPILLAEGRIVREIVLTHVHPDHIGGVQALNDLLRKKHEEAVAVAAHRETSESRSEERRVGEECRSRWGAYH